MQYQLASEAWNPEKLTEKLTVSNDSNFLKKNIQHYEILKPPCHPNSSMITTNDGHRTQICAKCGTVILRDGIFIGPSASEVKGGRAPF